MLKLVNDHSIFAILNSRFKTAIICNVFIFYYFSTQRFYSAGYTTYIYKIIDNFYIFV